MRVAVIGSGGREHALAWKLAASSGVTALYALPGNPGTQQVAENVPVAVENLAAIEKFIRQNRIELVVIGPEEPLAAGLTDRLAKVPVKVFGPGKEAAQIEADKWVAKELMRHQSIPTAEARSFIDADAAEEYVRMRDEPLVIKAAGLARGKGVTVCYRISDALETIERVMRKKEFGAAGERIIIEEKLSGSECSVMALVSGRSIYLLESAQDHKTVDDGNTGPMTGGMGAYSPTALVTDSLLKQIEREILVPAVDGLIRNGIEYQGVLYAGLMLTANGPKVLEFNCRFGDPETQPLMMRLSSDLLEALLAVVDDRLDDLNLRWDPRPAVCVVAASRGYPGKYQTGVPITGVEQADALTDVKVFHSGTAAAGNGLVTSGGRVLSVTALGTSIAQARNRAYSAMGQISFQGMHFRNDIGHQAMPGSRI